MAETGGRRRPVPTRSVPIGPGASGSRERILDATLRCIARWGIAKTSLDDVAREASCARATIYRGFPGGRDSVLFAAGEREVRSFLDDLAARLDDVDTLDDLLVVTLVTATRAIRGHEALRYLIAHEPGPVLAHVSFDGLDPLLTLACEFGAPELERFLAPAAARATAEWTARMIVVHVLDPASFDLAEPDEARRLVTTYLLPGLTPHLLSGSTAA
jgi:AcrR family transcriptional regulator